MVYDNPRKLPGFNKKSFLLYYNGGEMWCEHLDGIYEFEDLVEEKLQTDIPYFSRPSQTSLIAFVMDETVFSEKILYEITDTITNGKKMFTRVCFVGADYKTKKLIKNSLKTKTFALGFINDFEKAKEWLISEAF